MRAALAIALAAALAACGDGIRVAPRAGSPTESDRPEACDRLDRRYDGLGQDCSFSLYSCPEVLCLCREDPSTFWVPAITCDDVGRCEGRLACPFACAERGGDACAP